MNCFLFHSILALTLVVAVLLLPSTEAFSLAGRLPSASTGSTTRLGISESLGRYIDEEYYREQHKDEYNFSWKRITNEPEILYHTHQGDLVFGDPHSFNNGNDIAIESTGSLVSLQRSSTHCNVRGQIMKLRPYEFMRECHNCANRCGCGSASKYYEKHLAPMRPVAQPAFVVAVAHA